MSVEVERATMPCEVCGAHVTELRRGRCWGCYLHWTESRPVGRGAACTICFEKRRDQLRLVELHRRSQPVCHGCAARIGRLQEIPASLDAIRKALRRDRRLDDRREGSLDHRVFPRERRVGERRGPPRAGASAAGIDAEAHLTAEDFEEVVVELDVGDVEEVEQTSVRKMDR